MKKTLCRCDKFKCAGDGCFRATKENLDTGEVEKTTKNAVIRCVRREENKPPKHLTYAEKDWNY